VLCLGYKADVIKDYFLHYNEALSNDFTLSNGGRDLQLVTSDIQDWRITFADTGLHANIGQRLAAVRKYVDSDDIFLANYGDTLTDAPLPELIEDFKARGKVAAFLSVRPTSTFHVVEMKDSHLVGSISDVSVSGLRVNGGYFIFRRELFDYMRAGEELVQEPFQRLIDEEQLVAYLHDGFWAPMDTLKDRQTLEEMNGTGNPPWAVWSAKHPEPVLVMGRA